MKGLDNFLLIEGIPVRQGGEDVNDEPRDAGDRGAILMLLSSLECAPAKSLRCGLTLDWEHRVIRIFRLKRRQPQEYPL
jgi:hypothetical protein